MSNIPRSAGAEPSGGVGQERQSAPAEPMSAHVIVLGNEKGGSGKSTTAMHVVVALLKSGATVAAIDLDGRQQSLNRYLENRAAWASRTGARLEMPTHRAIRRSPADTVRDAEQAEFAAFAEAVAEVERSHDFLVIDTPGADSYLMRLAHSMADTLITPLNDSFVDFDVLGRIDPQSGAVLGASHYTEMVAAARRQRRNVDGGVTDWIVVRNRLAQLESRNQRQVGDSLSQLAMTLGFRLAEGISERVVYRAFFAMGLTALDPIDEETLGQKPSFSHLAARQEVRALIETLRLPAPRGAETIAAARAGWRRSMEESLAAHGLVT